MTDPRYYGQKLTSKQEEQGETWLTEHYPQFLPGLLLFKIKDNSAFPAVMFSEDIVRQFTVAKWWQVIEPKCAKLNKLPDGFCRFFYQLHSVPASSGSIERVFSTFGYVWSKMRNRLGADKAQKLVKVFRHLRDEDCEGW